jgi:hypothetical protein
LPWGWGMFKELLNGDIWNKTSQLIADQYGKKIEFNFLTIIESDQSFYSKGDDLVIPLKSHSRYLGDVVVQRGATMSLGEKMELIDLIQFLIEPQVYNLHLKISETSLSAKKLNQNTLNENRYENVISIFGQPQVDHKEIESETPQIKKSISNILHLKSKNADLRYKVAMQIHEISGASFFIQMKDITKSIHSAHDLIELNGATIYIDNILHLSSGEIHIIADFAKDYPQVNLQFLIGSDLTEKEILKLPCHEQLRNDLIGFFFDIDRVPVSQKLNGHIYKDVLELLFFSFDQSIS